MTRGPGRFSGSRRLDGSVVAALAATDAAGIVADVVGDRVDHAGAVVGLAAVAMASALSFWWRRSRPLLVLGVCVATVVAAGAVVEGALLSHRTGVQFALAAYAVASWAERRRLAIVVPAVIASVTAIALAADGQAIATVLAVPAAVVGAPWFAGAAARSRRRYLAEVEARLATAERETAERARVAVVEERQRVARELHDVVAHHVSLIGVQAGAARLALGHSPSSVGPALTSIESSSRQAVAEMRLLLGALRDADDNDLAPTPGLADVPRLVDEFRSAGLVVQGSVDSAPADDTVGLVAYRIVEEALANVTRHSASGSCVVRITHSTDALRVVVDDPGPPLARVAGRDGFGLRGIRERVAAVGGRVVIGPRLGGGFLVDAVLPLGTAR